MVDLTAPEIRALLWHIHTVDVAYGNEPPEGTTIDSAKHKLLEELEADMHVVRRSDAGREG